MSGLIDSLKARRAGIAGMLNPGKTGKFGNGLLLNSSSLQPQTIFRQLKASFSVKRPSVTVMREKSLELFSKKTESKYNSGMSLLHLKPASYSSSPSSTIQRSPTSMPLPVSGGTAGIQSGNNGSVSVPSNTVSSMPSYPAPSERRPVVFDRSDGPSDFEKRLMAAKKQKQETEAKQKGPDRRRVRTERVEISPSSSKDEVNRDFSPFDVPEPPVPPIVKNDRTVRDSSKSDRPSVSRQMDTVSTQRVESQKTTSTIETRVARRPGNVISREYAPAKQKSENEIRRELLSSAESVQDSTQEAGKQAEVITAGIETIQREPAKSAEPVQVSAHETEKQVEAVPFRDETIQRESLKAAEPVQASSHEMEKQAEVVQLRNETIQRESQKPAGPVQVPSQESEKPVETVQSKNGTIQRDPLGDGEPVHVQNKKTKKTSQAATNQSKPIQREPLDTFEDVRVGTVDNEKNAEKVSSPSEMIQREPLKAAEPVHEELDQAENHEKGAEAITSPSETVFREPLKAAKPIRVQTENHENGAEAIPSETIQREPIKSAKPVHIQNDLHTEDNPVPPEMIQRAYLKTAEPLQYDPDKAVTEMPVIQRIFTDEPTLQETEKTAVSAHNENSVIQRQMIQSMDHLPENIDGVNNSISPIDERSNVIQREIIKRAEPLSDSEISQKNADNTVQREISTAGGDLQSLLSTLPTHYEMPKEQIEAIRSGKNISSQNSSIQREYSRIPSDINQQSKKEDHMSAISTQNEIQRTVDLVLPKPPEKSKGSGSVSKIQRESVKKDQPAMMSFPFPTSMGQLPGANSENRSSRNYQNNDYPGDSDFSGASGSDTIQRELDTKSSEKSGKTTDSTDFGFLFSDKEKEEIKKESPKVTPRELEILADRLLPRIKRIMRSEMERSIFR